MKKTLILIVVLFALISVIVILGNIITIGEKMTTALGSPYLEYAFYVLLLGVFVYLVYVAILQPMMRIHNAPEFPVLSVEDKKAGVADDVYQKKLTTFAERLCDNCYYLPATKRESHQQEMRSDLAKVVSSNDIEDLKRFLSAELKQRYRMVDKHILTYGSKVFIITSVSSSSRIDTLATLGLNYRMVSDIVRASGFRPNKLQLIRMYYYVISSAFFSYFFQGASEYVDDVVDGLTDSAADIDVSDVEIPDVDASCVDLTQYVKSLNLPGIPLAPLADGLANAVMTIAIGYITKCYLQKGSKELKGAKGRTVKLKSKMKALGQVPRLLAEVPQQIGNTGLSWAMKGFEKAYAKVSKNAKTEEAEKTLADIDDYYVEEKPKKKGIFNFWR
ncbi:MAG: DUF697 domain-containing protein [Prevotella sp.]|nr:DUF697 domain-containing protein [Prevotella sp.]